MTDVVIWPDCFAASTSYSDPNIIHGTVDYDGVAGQPVEVVQRSAVKISGPIVRANAADWRIFMARLRGGLRYVGVIDFEMRQEMGWDLVPAVNSSGAEFWRANGRTSSYAGEAANAPTGPWRSINASAVGAHSAGATSLSVDGLLASEVIPKGTVVRHGDYRNYTTADVTANGSGAATLTLAEGLRAAVADNDSIRVPGDFFIGVLNPRRISVTPADEDGRRTFSATVIEQYSDEAPSAFSYPFQ